MISDRIVVVCSSLERLPANTSTIFELLDPTNDETWDTGFYKQRTDRWMRRRGEALFTGSAMSNILGLGTRKMQSEKMGKNFHKADSITERAHGLRYRA